MPEKTERKPYRRDNLEVSGVVMVGNGPDHVKAPDHAAETFAVLKKDGARGSVVEMVDFFPSREEAEEYLELIAVDGRSEEILRQMRGEISAPASGLGGEITALELVLELAERFMREGALADSPDDERQPYLNAIAEIRATHPEFAE